MSTKATTLNFNARTVTPSSEGQSSIPAGWYNATVQDGEVKATKGANAGSSLNLTYKVLDGEYEGSVVFGKFTMENASAKAVEIGQQDLSALCHAVNVMDVTNDKVFNGKTLQIKVGFEKQSEADVKKYGEKNKVKAWKPLEGATAATFIPAGPQPLPQSTPVSAETFPPEGWTAHPENPAYFFKGSEVLTEADLRLKFAPAPVAVIPAALPPAPAPIPAALPPAPAPVVAFPPAGWTAHPDAPGYYYAGQEVVTEGDLRARFAAPAVSSLPPAPAAIPTAGDVPPWEA